MFDQPPTPTPSDSFYPTQARGQVYALLANAWAYPEASLVDRLRAVAVSEAMMPEHVFQSESVLESAHALRAHCHRWQVQPAECVVQELRTAHVRLFGHAVRGTCPPYELEYGQSEIIQQTAELADLSGFYRAFGLDIRETAFERADHVSIQCEFMSILCAKEAWGLAIGNDALVECCADAQRLFLRDHLGRWLTAFARRVIKENANGFYGAVASLAAAFIHAECERFELETGPQWLELRPTDPVRDQTIDCAPAGCGSPAGESFVQLGVESRAGDRRL